MKKVFFFLFLYLVLFCTHSYADTVYTFKDSLLPSNNNVTTGGLKMDGVSCAAGGGAPHETGLMYVDRVDSLVMSIAFTDANSSTAYLDVYCRSTNSALTAGIYYDMPVLTSTAPTGISTATTSKIRWVSTGGGAPGSSNFTLTFSHLPDKELNCYIECGPGYEAADTLLVYVRGITP